MSSHHSSSHRRSDDSKHPERPGFAMNLPIMEIGPLAGLDSARLAAVTRPLPAESPFSPTEMSRNARRRRRQKLKQELELKEAQLALQLATSPKRGILQSPGAFSPVRPMSAVTPAKTQGWRTKVMSPSNQQPLVAATALAQPSLNAPLASPAVPRPEPFAFDSQSVPLVPPRTAFSARGRGARIGGLNRSSSSASIRRPLGDDLRVSEWTDADLDSTIPKLQDEVAKLKYELSRMKGAPARKPGLGKKFKAGIKSPMAKGAGGFGPRGPVRRLKSTKPGMNIGEEMKRLAIDDNSLISLKPTIMKELDFAPFIAPQKADYYPQVNSGRSSASSSSGSEYSRSPSRSRSRSRSRSPPPKSAIANVVDAFVNMKIGDRKENSNNRRSRSRSRRSRSASRSPSRSGSSNYSGSSSASTDDGESFPYESNLFALSRYYHFVERLYTAPDAITYKAVDKQTGEFVVLKLVDDFDGKKDPKEVRLINIAQGHENIMKFYGWHHLPATRCYCIITEFIPHKPIETVLFGQPQKIRTYVRDMISALIHMHRRNILYRDIKPSNVLWDHTKNRARLIDFDVATLFSKENLHRSIVGTDGYIGPEMLKIQAAKRARAPLPYRGYGMDVDTYSAGVLLAQCIFEELEDDVADLDNPDTKGRAFRERCLRMKGSRDFDHVHDLIIRMLEEEPSKRISLTDALQHPYFFKPIKARPHKPWSKPGSRGNSRSRSRSRSASRSYSRSRSRSYSRSRSRSGSRSRSRSRSRSQSSASGSVASSVQSDTPRRPGQRVYNYADHKKYMDSKNNRAPQRIPENSKPAQQAGKPSTFLAQIIGEQRGNPRQVVKKPQNQNQQKAASSIASLFGGKPAAGANNRRSRSRSRSYSRSRSRSGSRSPSGSRSRSRTGSRSGSVSARSGSASGSASARSNYSSNPPSARPGRRRY